MIQLKRILVPTDFSQFSEHAIKYGAEFARKFEAELVLVNVVEDIYPIVPEPGMGLPPVNQYLAELQTSAERAFENFPNPEWMEGLTVTKQVISGTPFLEIIRCARERDVDMIVIGTHGRSGLIHALMGSVAEKVVRKAPCPVLSVRPDGHDFVMP